MTWSFSERTTGFEPATLTLAMSTDASTLSTPSAEQVFVQRTVHTVRRVSPDPVTVGNGWCQLGSRRPAACGHCPARRGVEDFACRSVWSVGVPSNLLTSAAVVRSRSPDPPRSDRYGPGCAGIVQDSALRCPTACYLFLMAQRQKRSISLPSDLADAIDVAATVEGTTVSAWIADTAAHRLRIEAGRQVFVEWERQHGALSPDEIADGLARARAMLRRQSARKSA